MDNDRWVCNASKLAPSWLLLARTKSPDPVCRVLIIALVKSKRMHGRKFEVGVEPSDSRVVRAVV